MSMSAPKSGTTSNSCTTTKKAWNFLSRRRATKRATFHHHPGADNMTKTVSLKREKISASPRNAVRDDFLPKDAYLSKDFLRLENERMWPRVWQIACRVEEVAKV